jgi:hypothetical protein
MRLAALGCAFVAGAFAFPAGWLVYGDLTEGPLSPAHGPPGTTIALLIAPFIVLFGWGAWKLSRRA